ncbi:EamA family transporter [Phenylobacterium sp.]|uniref:EamA family transporter n=1 Tax=Phenylobacterium sp. TaxID=1871053 RepID=UPI0025E302F9|nr:EamA family transporter [Phenylobacterium sp.]MCA6286551.1 EamA family transporter [Phenylobacterium sp.]MCA6289879.1 EamA family transporter [Phenylobacterium sp.]MCA6311406.1 EamA family transporter [Phenylobacterium sp.]MCA6322959.1 EamA family transporter [Phenylobacterium sp.]MCA6337923.1 EamA family transporter [Phenylobacterium sp.]
MTAMPWRHALLALAVVAVWGTNFAVIKSALSHLPPFTFATLRFLFAFLPAAFFLKRPQVPWRNLAAYGILIGVGQFGVLYFAMDGRISPGLASLVVQSQVFFTIGLAIWLKGERLSLRQGIALVLAAAGLAVILSNVDAATTSVGLGLVLVAALSWALGNMVQRATPEAPSLAFVVWASLFSIPPLLVLALVFEGAPALVSAVATMTPVVWAELLYQSFGNTLFGYAAWGWLLARHPAAMVSPWALLVPVFGLTVSALALGEPLPPWKLAAAALVIGGLALNTLPAFRLRRDRTGAVG